MPKSFTYDEALQQLKAGKKLLREGWLGTGAYLEQKTPDTIEIFYPVGHFMKLKGERKTWTPSTTEVLGTDWLLFE
jgi:Protein of unknown function (DUF2829)